MDQHTQVQQNQFKLNDPTSTKNQQRKQQIKQPDSENIEQINDQKDIEQYQSQESQTEIQSSDNQKQFDAQYQGFQIIGAQSENQALLVKLQPDNILWHQGIILFSSKIPKQKMELDDIGKRLMEGLGFWNPSPIQLSNEGNQMQYYIISKQQPLNGKILILSHNIYNQNFFINPSHLLSINLQSSEYTLKPHPYFKYLKQIEPKTTSTSLFLSLQSTKSTPIIQKYLAAQESMYLPNAKIIAMGQNVKCRWEPRHRMYRLSGEGFVFFQPYTNANNTINKLVRQEMLLINIAFICFIISLYIIEHMFLR